MVRHIVTEMTVMKEEVCTQIPRNMKDATLYRATQANTRVGQEAKEAGETLCKNCVVVSIGEA